MVSYGIPAVSSVSTSMQQYGLSSACLSAASTPVRPNLAVYAPAFTGAYLFPVILQLAAAWPPLTNTSLCGSQLQCLLAVRNGAIKAGSLTALDASGLLYSVQVRERGPGGAGKKEGLNEQQVRGRVLDLAGEEEGSLVAQG